MQGLIDSGTCVSRGFSAVTVEEVIALLVLEAGTRKIDGHNSNTYFPILQLIPSSPNQLSVWVKLLVFKVRYIN